jgi:hypothetical protein
MGEILASGDECGNIMLSSVTSGELLYVVKPHLMNTISALQS